MTVTSLLGHLILIIFPKDLNPPQYGVMLLKQNVHNPRYCRFLSSREDKLGRAAIAWEGSSALAIYGFCSSWA